MKNSVQIKELEFSYDRAIEVLDYIDFSIPKGSFVSVLGPNGSGKTTLLKNICNLLKPNKGNVLIDNKDVRTIKYKELAKKMAVVHQGNDIRFNFSVFDIVLMGRFPYLKKFQQEQKVDIEVAKKAMKNTSTWHLKEKNINEISGGEKQRVMIARALTQQPEILLLDEPISHLDIKHQISILNLCKKLNTEKSLTILTTLHDINLASRYSDYIVLLHEGKVKIVDTPEKVITKEIIKEVYGVDVELIKLSEDSRPYIIPKEVF
ncbi:ABC transporter ATP-binding protein [Caldisalinibacter kiritimatiensis]|uniref:Vitamin B12 ABC transporter, ATPase component BtuD n=1 Tax=Caldisalinibacter kiritimatiensis TaxID=1304284 RepID=R1CPY2_9FIRM|nr:ABC transporter ATP-binding protein [Caldisalinibacter kiritimatiensis]EOD00741.1 Vitamin B12 ABC transporter, ATPase component BtuD [Caldisalinibacter kiritimatiensis]